MTEVNQPATPEVGDHIEHEMVAGLTRLAAMPNIALKNGEGEPYPVCSSVTMTPARARQFLASLAPAAPVSTCDEYCGYSSDIRRVEHSVECEAKRAPSAPAEGLREAYARIINNGFGDPKHIVPTAANAMWAEALTKSDAILATQSPLDGDRLKAALDALRVDLTLRYKRAQNAETEHRAPRLAEAIRVALEQIEAALTPKASS